MTRTNTILGAMLLAATITNIIGAAAAPIPVIVDTDIGQDMDDSWSLAFMAGRPDLFDIKLVVSATRDTHGRAQIIAKYLDAIGRTARASHHHPPRHYAHKAAALLTLVAFVVII